MEYYFWTDSDHVLSHNGVVVYLDANGNNISTWFVG
jgi:hypothetical protein